jgi:hypothetical protein
MSGLEASLLLIAGLIVVSVLLVALFGVAVFFLDRLWGG